MSDFIKRLQEQRANLWEGMKATLDKAAEEGRDLTVEEQTAYDQRNADLDQLDGRVKELRDAEKRTAEAEQAFADLAARPQEREQSGEPEGSAVQLRAMLTGKGAFEARSAGPVGTDEYRALSKLTAAAGANTVKVTFYDRLIAHMIEVSGLLSAGPTVLTTTSGEQITVPKTTAHSTASRIAELGTLPQSDPTFGQVPLDAYKYALLLQISSELVTDSSVDIEGYIATQAGRAVGNAFGAELMTGSGSNMPNGLAGAATVGVTGGTGVTGAFTYENLLDLFYSVISPYRNSGSCGWLLRDQSMATVRKLKDGSGRYIFEPGVAGAPDTVLAKPVNTDPNVAAVGLNNRSVLFGDMSAYFVRQVNGVRFERSTDFAFNTDAITYRVILRGDGDLVDTSGAIKAFVGAAS